MIRYVLLALLVLASPVLADEVVGAKALYEKGEALLDQAKFEDAAEAFKAAAKADPENKVYRGRAIILVRVLRARKYVAESAVDAKWERVAQSLHVFYLREGLSGEAVTLDRRMYTERPGPVSAALLSEALLDAGKNEEALTHVSALPADQKDVQNRVYEGIALARLEKADQAKKLYEGLDLAKIEPGVLYDVARLQALLGDQKAALATLAKCFEGLTEKSQKAFRTMAERCADFDVFGGSEAFTAALNTKSKVEESSCSGSTEGCGSCPNRGGCGSKKE